MGTLKSLCIHLLINLAIKCTVLVYEQSHVNARHIYLFARYLSSASLPSTVLKHREINVTMIRLVLSSSSSPSKFSGTIQGGERQDIMFMLYFEGSAEVLQEDKHQPGQGSVGGRKGGFQAEGVLYGPTVCRHSSSLVSEHAGIVVCRLDSGILSQRV